MDINFDPYLCICRKETMIFCGESMISCPRAECGKSAHSAENIRHVKAKLADMEVLHLLPSRHIYESKAGECLRI